MCGQIFSNWPTLMMHRKKIHYVKDCTNKNCQYGPENCLYNHKNAKTTFEEPNKNSNKTKASNLNHEAVDFPPLGPTKDPDPIREIVEMKRMITQIFQKIQQLEKNVITVEN